MHGGSLMLFRLSLDACPGRSLFPRPLSRYSDCMHAHAGAVCGEADFIRALVDLQVGPVMLMGPTMDAKVASELSLRLAHLGIRMAEHSRRASAYAHRLHQVSVPLIRASWLFRTATALESLF